MAKRIITISREFLGSGGRFMGKESAGKKLGTVFFAVPFLFFWKVKYDTEEE